MGATTELHRNRYIQLHISRGFQHCFNYQGSYTSGKCQGNLKIFKVRELSGNLMMCQ